VRCAARLLAFVTLCFAVCPLLAWGDTGPVTFPKRGEGYGITAIDSSQVAPSGYEGRTDKSQQTAVGNTR
jgi:hypothetical protein